MEYREKLNPKHSLTMTRGTKGTKQMGIVTQDLGTMDQNELLLAEFPNLGCDDVIIPGMMNLSFKIKLSSITDPKRALVSNIGRAIVKKLSVSLAEMLYLTWMILTCFLANETCER